MLLKRDVKKIFFGLLIFIVFSFSDFYYKDIGRAFDYVFLAGLLVYFGVVRIKGSDQASSMCLVAILSIWLIAGMFNKNLLASLAILVGVGFVFVLFNRSDFSIELPFINRILKITIFINALILVFQVLVYYQFGSFLDFSDMVGSIKSRGYNQGLDYFRPSGLFQEPNAYCAVMFCLLSLRLLHFGPTSYVDYFGWGTMILTQSLWGFGAALVLFWLMIGTKRFILLVLPLGVLAAILFSSLIVAFMDYSENSIAMTRLLNIADDPSRRARYGSIENIIVDEFLLLGHGVDTSNFQSIGANALAFLVYCFGIAGIALLVVWGVAIQKISATHAILIGFIFTTFPLFSYMYFWVWLGLLLALNKGKAHNSRLSPSISKVPGRSATLINH